MKLGSQTNSLTGTYKDLVPKYRKQYTTDELLKLAVKMLDKAAEEGVDWLHDNLALEVMRDRVS